MVSKGTQHQNRGKFWVRLLLSGIHTRVNTVALSAWPASEKFTPTSSQQLGKKSLVHIQKRLLHL